MRFPIRSNTSIVVASKDTLSPGKHTIKFDFEYDGPGFGKGGAGTLSVDGKFVAQGKIERTIPVRFSLDETLDIAKDTGTPVVEEYVDKMPFEFTGRIDKVVIELGNSGVAFDDTTIKRGNQAVATVRE